MNVPTSATLPARRSSRYTIGVDRAVVFARRSFVFGMLKNSRRVGSEQGLSSGTDGVTVVWGLVPLCGSRVFRFSVDSGGVFWFGNRHSGFDRFWRRQPNDSRFRVGRRLARITETASGASFAQPRRHLPGKCQGVDGVGVTSSQSSVTRDDCVDRGFGGDWRDRLLLSSFSCLWAGDQGLEGRS